MPAFNEIKIGTLLPNLFSRSKHFTPEQYYQQVIKICPECTKKWYERIPTEQQIQKMINEFVGEGIIDGKTSVPTAEQKLGIQIDPGYKYPNSMTDLEYHLEHFYKYGLFSPFRKTAADDYKACFDAVIRDGVTYYSKKPNKTRAYYIAWQKLQYPDRDKIIAQMQADWRQLCELNPVLKTIKFNNDDLASLTMAIAGVIYGFPPRDIELFVNEHSKGEKGVGMRHNARIIRETASAGLPHGFRFGWVPHSDTIAEIGRRYQEKNKKLQNAVIKTAMQKD